MPTRIDNIVGNPVKDRPGTELDPPDSSYFSDYFKTIWEILPDQSVVKGTITKHSKGYPDKDCPKASGFELRGTFRVADGSYKNAPLDLDGKPQRSNMTCADKLFIIADFNKEKSALKDNNKGKLAAYLTPLPSLSDSPPESMVCSDDADGDGIADAADNCPLISNPGQADSVGDGIGGWRSIRMSGAQARQWRVRSGQA